MKRIISTLAVVAVLFPATVMAQEFQGALFGVTISNAAGRSEYLKLGVGIGATSGLDALLGEYELPPAPPTGVFDARIISTPSKSQLGTGSKFDCRPVASQTAPFTETYTLAWQAGEGQANVTIRWDLPLNSRVTLVKIDGASIEGKTEIVSQFAQGQASVEITYNYKPLSFRVNPTQLSFNANNRDPLPAQTLEIIPEGEAEAAWQVYSDVEWLDIDPPTGAGHSTVQVSINTPHLTAGSYNGVLTVGSPNEPTRTPVPVTLQMVVGVEPVQPPADFALLAAHPNPTSGVTVLDMDAGAVSRPLRLTVHDLLGRQVYDLSTDLPLHGGRQRIRLDASALPPGMYTVRLSDGAQMRALQLMIIR